MITYSTQTDLPSGYTQVEYLESTGTQYIDLNYIPKANSIFDVDFQSTKVVNDPYTSLFGTQISSESNGRFYVLFGQLNNVQINIPRNSIFVAYLAANGTVSDTAISSSAFFTNDRAHYIVDIANKTVQIGNIIWDTSSVLTGTFQSPDYSVYLLARNTKGVADDTCSKGFLYGCVIKESNTIVKNFIPARRNSDNVVGMYDTVTGNFLTNAGTGTFIAGPVVTHELKERYIGDKEVQRVYIGDDLVTILKVDEADAEFYYRKTGGTQSVGSGIAAIKEVRGKSIVWNQLVNVSQLRNRGSATITRSGSTATITLTGTNNLSGIIDNIRLQRGHKILLYYKRYVKPSTSYAVAFYKDETSNPIFSQAIKTSSSETYHEKNFLLTLDDSVTGFFITCANIVAKGEVYTFSDVVIFDLTLMFGAGNEPATVEEFKKMFPLDYYDYNAGEIIPFAGQNLVTTGKNQYNPTTGKANLLGGYTYQLLGTYTGATIDGVAVTLDSNSCFTTTKDCVLEITGGNDTDTFVGLYNGENNTFEPYTRHTLPLDPSQWRDTNDNLVFPYGGMHGVGDVYDYAKVDADGYIRKVVRVFEQVDLGSLNYALYQPANQDYANCFRAELPIRAKVVGRGGLWKEFITPNGYISCFGYGSNYIKDKCLNTDNGDGIYLQIGNNSYSNTTTFKAAMNGIPLIYELNTPVEVELATPVYAKYLVDKDGTEEITPANGTAPYTTMANLHLVYRKK